MNTCETIKVVAKNEQGYIVINLCDKKESDTIYKEKQIKKNRTKRSNN